MVSEMGVWMGFGRAKAGYFCCLSSHWSFHTYSSASLQGIGNCTFRLTASPITTFLSLSDSLQGLLNIQKQLEGSSLWKVRLWSHMQETPGSYTGNRTLRAHKALWSILAHKMLCLTRTAVGQWTVGRHEGDHVMHYEPCKLHILAQHLLWHHFLVLQGPVYTPHSAQLF